MGINRNIVECKWRRCWKPWQTQGVLIETLWNVNEATRPIRGLWSRRINRNIVECKWRKTYLSENYQMVLIETLWNVNTATIGSNILSFRINRNIVECKYRMVRTYWLHLLGINRNIVECKLRYWVFSAVMILSINRNIVECKWGRERFKREFERVLIETLWNVNKHVPQLLSKEVIVLIETLWNVNSGEQNPARGDGSGINRNIVECKFIKEGYSTLATTY